MRLPRCWHYGVYYGVDLLRSNHYAYFVPTCAAAAIVALINVVALRRARLVLGWVTVRG